MNNHNNRNTNYTQMYKNSTSTPVEEPETMESQPCENESEVHKNESKVKMVITGTKALRIRQAPTLFAEPILPEERAIITDGQIVDVDVLDSEIQTFKDEANYQWVKVTLNTGEQGYSMLKYLKEL